MKDAIEDVISRVSALTPQQQAVVLARIHELVNPPDPQWADAWAAECRDRLAALERGEIETFDADELMAELEAKYELR